MEPFGILIHLSLHRTDAFLLVVALAFHILKIVLHFSRSQRTRGLGYPPGTGN